MFSVYVRILDTMCVSRVMKEDKNTQFYRTWKMLILYIYMENENAHSLIPHSEILFYFILFFSFFRMLEVLFEVFQLLHTVYILVMPRL